MTDQQKTILIRKNIIEACKDFRLKYPILKYQDLIGGLIFILSLSAIVFESILYLKGNLSVWILIS